MSSRSEILGSSDPMSIVMVRCQYWISLSVVELSKDSKSGESLYRFGVSLMEHLSSGGLVMSQL